MLSSFLITPPIKGKEWCMKCTLYDFAALNEMKTEDCPTGTSVMQQNKTGSTKNKVGKEKPKRLIDRDGKLEVIGSGQKGH